VRTLCTYQRGHGAGKNKLEVGEDPRDGVEGSV
jgi:hypothetical protein